MKGLILKIAGVIATLGLPFIFSATVRAAADTCTWTGGGSDNNFSTAANWTGCDNGTVPENGDTLVFDATVDSDTTFGDDRVLTNDLVSLSVAGISVSNQYAEGDFDYYEIEGNDISLTGNLIGAPTGNENRRMQFSVDLVATVPLAIRYITSAGSLDIGVNDVTVQYVLFEGSVAGSGDLTVTGIAGGGGAGCSFYGDISGTYGFPFRAASASFSGGVVVGTYGNVTVTSLAEHFARNASSLTIGEDATLNFSLSSGQNMTFATPLSFSGGRIITAHAYIDADCDTRESNPTITVSGSVTATGDVEVLLNDSNLTFSGSVTGGDYFSVLAGGDPTAVFTVNGESQVSEAVVTTYTGDQSGTSPSLGENNMAIVSAGATVGNVSVYGGTLKGVGTVGIIFMSNGVVAPGLSPGCLNSGALSYSGGTLEIEIEGSTVCTQYDQQVVTGTVDLGAATTLDINRLSSYRPALNEVYIIINNDASDAVTGTFSGLAQGATTVVDGVTYTISYTGGDGNDVTLTVTAIDNSVGAPNTGVMHLVKNGTLLPVIAILSAAGLFAVNFAQKKQ